MSAEDLAFKIYMLKNHYKNLLGDILTDAISTETTDVDELEIIHKKAVDIVKEYEKLRNVPPEITEDTDYKELQYRHNVACELLKHRNEGEEDRRYHLACCRIQHYKDVRFDIKALIMATSLLTYIKEKMDNETQ